MSDAEKDMSSPPTERPGGCACGAIRYRLTRDPMFVHACHCRDCQRLSGSACVLNAWIEESAVVLLEGTPTSHRLSGGSGQAHEVFFCGGCGTYVWSRYHASPRGSLFVRVGTLDDPTSLRPDVHIYTRSMQAWFVLPPEVPSFEAFYALKRQWPAASLARLAALRA